MLAPSALALVAPCRPTWSRSADPTRLEQVLSVVEPGWCSPRILRAYGAALARAARGARVVTVDGRYDDGRGLRLRRTGQCLDRRRGGRAAAAYRAGHAGQDPVHVGSTGQPKGVLNTHGNLAAATEMNCLRSASCSTRTGSASLDWLPWHHAWGRQLQLQRRHPLGRLARHRWRPAAARPLRRDAGEPARALAVGFRHRAGGLSAARGARA